MTRFATWALLAMYALAAVMFLHLMWRARGLLPLLVMLLVAVGGAASPGFAHSWYDPSCCDTADCRPMLASEQVKALPEGAYMVRVKGRDLFVEKSRVKPSQDGEFHVCLGGGDDLWVRCLYVPLGV